MEVEWKSEKKKRSMVEHRKHRKWKKGKTR